MRGPVRTITICVLAAIGAARCGIPARANPPGCPPPGQARAAVKVDDRGTFEISAGGVPIGTETFEIRARGNQIEAQSEVRLHVEQEGKAREVRTSSSLVLDAGLNPVSYNWSQKGTPSSQLSINFDSQPVQVHYRTISGQDERRDFKLDRAVVLLDDNALHQYQLALARYDAVKGGRQTFGAFIPQEALPGMINLSLAGTEPVTIAGKQRLLRHFLLATDLAQINLWADEEGRLQMVSVPSAQYQAVRTRP